MHQQPSQIAKVLGSFMFLVGQVISSILLSPVSLFCLFLPSLLPSLLRAQIVILWMRFNIWSLQHTCGITYQVHGAENILLKPSIILSNHQSAWETLCFHLIFPPQSNIIKRQLLWIPFFGWGLAATQPVSINRSKKSKALQQLCEQGIKRLKAGQWLVVFPEGTRCPPGQLAMFQTGGALIAARSGAAVVPVVHNAGLYWPKNGFLKHPGVIQVHIGKAIDTNNKKPREINAEAEAWIKKTLETLPSIQQPPK